MNNAIYVALSKQTASFRELDVIANNIANANTTGYKSESMMFHDFMAKDGNARLDYAQDLGSYIDTKQGGLTTTGNQLDFAIDGEGFFAVDTPLGKRYTRAGSFRLDQDGNLITPAGYFVLDDAGQKITFQDTDSQITVSGNGTLSAGGDERGKLGIFKFDNPQELERVSDSVFKSETDPATAENYQVAQGMIENSNVEPVAELTRMIVVQRRTASASNFINSMYDLQQKAIGRLGRQG